MDCVHGGCRHYDEMLEPKIVCGLPKLSIQDVARRIWKCGKYSGKFCVRTIFKAVPDWVGPKVPTARNWFEESKRRLNQQSAPNAICEISNKDNGIVIGRGAHGVVRLAFHNGRIVAVKTMKLTTNTTADSAQCPPEKLFMHGIRHPNLVQIHGVQPISDPSGMNGSESVEDILFSDVSFDGIRGSTRSKSHKRYNVVMEYCDRGSLWDAIKRGEFFDRGTSSMPNYKKIIEVALEVAIGLHHLHRFGIIHGDIKSDNILLQSSNSASKGFIAKIGDYGNCRRPNNG